MWCHERRVRISVPAAPDGGGRALRASRTPRSPARRARHRLAISASTAASDARRDCGSGRRRRSRRWTHRPPSGAGPRPCGPPGSSPPAHRPAETPPAPPSPRGRPAARTRCGRHPAGRCTAPAATARAPRRNRSGAAPPAAPAGGWRATAGRDETRPGRRSVSRRGGSITRAGSVRGIEGP